jgi:hypothetical protein
MRLGIVEEICICFNRSDMIYNLLIILIFMAAHLSAVALSYLESGVSSRRSTAASSRPTVA